MEQRVIKFRAWNKQQQKFLQISSLLFTNNLIGMGAHSAVNVPPDHKYYPSDENILMQFIGLQDKNEKDIYESDIIKSLIVTGGISEKKEGYMYGYVKYSENQYSIFPIRYKGAINSVFGEGEGKIYGFLRDDFNRDKNSYEIIGNIYEHPHLLK